MDKQFTLNDFRDSMNGPVQKPDDAPVDWRISAYAAITSLDYPGCVLMVRTSDSEDAWQFPGGGVEVHEGLLEGLRREIQEETGYDDVTIFSERVTLDEQAFYWRSKDAFFHAVILIFPGEVAAGTPEKLRVGDPENAGEITEQRWMPLKSLDPASVHHIHRAYVEKLKGAMIS